MARSKAAQTNIDNSAPTVYLQGRIKNNTGAGDGTPVNEFIYGDLHQFFAKLMALGGIPYNNLPDNESNGYQLIEALKFQASKNDKLVSLTMSGGVLSVPLKLGLLTEGEVFTAKSTVDFDSETQIKGTLDNVTKSASVVGNFKTGDYLRLVNGTSGVSIVRLTDNFNLDAQVAAFSFLKAATEPEAVAGIINTAAITPETFLAAFAEYVIGATSANFLATQLRNGLLSAADKAILDNIGNDRVRNVGNFSGIDVDGSSLGTTYPTSGGITFATVVQKTTEGEVVEVTFANAMDNNSYKLAISVESNGAYEQDNDIKPIVWKVVNTTKAQVFIEETANAAQNLKIHIDAIQL